MGSFVWDDSQIIAKLLSKKSNPMRGKRSCVHVAIAFVALTAMETVRADSRRDSVEDTTAPRLGEKIAAEITDPSNQPHGTFIDPGALPEAAKATLAKIKPHIERATVEQLCESEGGLWEPFDKPYVIPGYTKDRKLLKIRIAYRPAAMPADVNANYAAYEKWIQQHNPTASPKDEAVFVSAPFLEYEIAD